MLPPALSSGGAWLVLPATLLLLVTSLFPLGYSLWTSLHYHVLTRPGQTRFVGLDNYLDVLRDPITWHSLQVTGWFVFGAVMLELFLGVTMALLLNRAMRGEGILRSLILLPVMLTPVVVALIWVFMFNPEVGVVNYLMGRLGLPDQIVWLGSPATALLSVILVDAWRNTPFVFMMTLAGLQSLPPEPFEAAIVDGATPWQVFSRVTMPLLKPVLLSVATIRGMDAFREFDLVYVLTGGGPSNVTEVVSVFTYRVAFRYFDIGRASTISFLILGVVMLFGFYFVRGMNRSIYES